MKILHISTNDTGGAASAAIRIHESLIYRDIDSSILFLNNTKYKSKNSFKFEGNTNSIKQPEYPILSLRNYFLEKIFKKFSKTKQLYLEQVLIKKKFEKRIQDDTLKKFELFSSPFSDFDINSLDKINDFDIIHLHWTVGFLDFPSFFETIKKPVVMSLHDEYYLLGAFHYSGDVYRNSTNEYFQLEEYYKKLKFESYKKCNSLSFLTGSDWVKEKVLECKDLNLKHLEKIYYPVNIELYRYIEKTICRRVLNLDLDKKIFLFASDNLSNYRKGFDILLSAIEDDSFNDVNFLILGNTNEIELKENFISLGKISDSLLMPIIYAASDFFILPSREENFSYTMIESLCCGTPTVAFNVGDHKTFLEDNAFGVVVENIDSISLRNVLMTLIKSEEIFNRQCISDKARLKFDSKVISSQLSAFYEKVLS